MAGTLVGALGALLLTPYTGQEIRYRLFKATNRIRENLSHRFRQAIERVEEEVMDIEEEE